MAARIACGTCRFVLTLRFPSLYLHTGLPLLTHAICYILLAYRVRKLVSPPRSANHRYVADLPDTPLQKCDSAMPRCGRCVQSGVLECLYDLTRKRLGNALAMGEACLPCRFVPHSCPADDGPWEMSLQVPMLTEFPFFFFPQLEKEG